MMAGRHQLKMISTNSFSRLGQWHKNVAMKLSFFLLLTCLACVPLHQQIAESETLENEGFVGPVVVNRDKFDRVVSSHVYDQATVDAQFHPSNNNITYSGTLNGNLVYIRNCRCLRDPRVIQNKLIVKHSYGGGESNRESTVLLWDGTYYQNRKGEYIVDVLLHSDKVDIRRAMIHDKKIIDVAPLQRAGVNEVWINLVGYDQLIKYAY